MKNNELTAYIKNYIEHDKTHSAIMLTAPWGRGKSYYIQNELIPTLENDKENRHECIVVSLYGMTDILEISRAIFFDCMMKMKLISSAKKQICIKKKKSRIAGVGLFAAKTVLKGATSFFGIDINTSVKDLKKLYDTVDLSGKLIVIEDLERSEIEITEILGYVNSLVEQDGVKVLLVANEEELIHYLPVNIKSKEEQELENILDKYAENINRDYTEGTKEYLKVKEKTVSDTLMFEGNVSDAIKQIMGKYENGFFKCFTEDDEQLKELLLFMDELNMTNLRTFVFACQKSYDIFKIIKDSKPENIDFDKTVFYGIIAFSNIIKSGNKIMWNGGRELSVELSLKKYPLFRFCYDYIMFQAFDKLKIKPAQKALEKYRLYDMDKSSNDKDLLVIYNWWIHYEKDVLQSVENVSKRLENESDISFFEYGRLALYLIKLKSVIKCNIEMAKSLLIKNLHNKANEIDAGYLFSIVPSPNDDKEIIREYEELKGSMIASLAAIEDTVFAFDYKPASIKQFAGIVESKRDSILQDRTFASKLNLGKTDEMLKSCAPEEIGTFSGIFITVYRSAYLHDLIENDREALTELLSILRDLRAYEQFDAIQKEQIKYFLRNIEAILKK